MGCAASVKVVPVDNTIWSPFKHSKSLKTRYQDDSSLNENFSTDVLTFRVLLDDKIGLKYIKKFATGDNFVLLNSWEYLSSIDPYSDTDFILNALKSMSMKHEQLVHNKARLESLSPTEHFEEIGSIRRNVLAILFKQLYCNVFIPFKRCDAYKILCGTLTKLNEISPKDFDFISKLGSGGYGCVFSCRKRNTGAFYAMKVQQKSSLLRQRGKNRNEVSLELRAMMACKHPYLCEVAYAFQTSKFVFIAEPVYSCGDLRKAMKQQPRGCFPPARAQFYTACIVSALIYMHTNGMVYRDLKPDNILIQFDGHIVLTDFGGVDDATGKFHLPGGVSFSTDNIKTLRTVSDPTLETYKGSNRSPAINGIISQNSIISGSSYQANGINPISYGTDAQNETNQSSFRSNGNVQRPLGVVGTMAYMSPESFGPFADQVGLNLIKKCTDAVDWFSLGVLLHEMLLGWLPFPIPPEISFQRLVQLYPSTLRSVQYDVGKAHSFIFGTFCLSDAAQDAIGLPAVNLITGLMLLDAKLRMGKNFSSETATPQDQDISLSHEVTEPSGDGNCYSTLMEHSYFTGINWPSLEKKEIPPPYVPTPGEVNYIPTNSIHTLESLLTVNRRGHWCERDRHGVLQGVEASMELNFQKHFQDWHYVSESVVDDEYRAESLAHMFA